MASFHETVSFSMQMSYYFNARLCRVKEKLRKCIPFCNTMRDSISSNIFAKVNSSIHVLFSRIFSCDLPHMACGCLGEPLSYLCEGKRVECFVGEGRQGCLFVGNFAMRCFLVTLVPKRNRPHTPSFAELRKPHCGVELNCLSSCREFLAPLLSSECH